ncbi:MAG: hypothetical protein HOD37_20395 [Bacteroidetes bacterium]|nr:hypothetical protein [Bacteroidota bacterium]
MKKRMQYISFGWLKWIAIFSFLSLNISCDKPSFAEKNINDAIYLLPVGHDLLYEISHSTLSGNHLFSQSIHINVKDSVSGAYHIELTIGERHGGNINVLNLNNMSKEYALLEACYELEQSALIEIDIDPAGFCKRIYGTEGLLDQIVDVLITMEPNFRSMIPFDFIEKRFGEDYYRYLINLIFPDFSLGSVSRKGIDYQQTQKILAKKSDKVSYQVQIDFHDAEDLNESVEGLLKDHAGQLNLPNGLTTRNSLTTLELNRFFITKGHAYPKWIEKRHLVKIVAHLVSDLPKKEEKARVFLNLLHHTDCRYYLDDKIQNYLVFPKPIPIEQGDSSLVISIDLEGGARFVKLFFDHRDIPLRSYDYFEHPAQLQLFVQAGDSIFISLDLNPFKVLAWRGSHSKENEILNDLGKYRRGGYADISLKIGRQNHDIIRENTDILSEDFLYHIDKELSFMLLSFKLEKMTDGIYRRGITEVINWSDSLRGFS